MSNTRSDYINFVSDVAKLRHIEFELKKPEHIEFNLGQATPITTPRDKPSLKKYESEEVTKTKPEYGRYIDVDYKPWLVIEEFRRREQEILHGPIIKSLTDEYENKQISYSYWDKNYWIHPDERCEPVIQKPVIQTRRGRRIRERVDHKPYDEVYYVEDKKDHHCHRYDSHKKAFDCCGIRLILTAQFNCTVEVPHIHYTRYKRIVIPAKTVHEYEEANDTIIETGEIYDFIDGFWHKVSIRNHEVLGKPYQEDKL